MKYRDAFYEVFLRVFGCVFVLSVSVASIYGNSFMIDSKMIYDMSANWQTNSVIGFDGTNFLVVWEDARKDNYSQIRGCRISPQGQVLDKGGFTISLVESFGFLPAIAYDGTQFLVVWQSQLPRSPMSLKAARVSTLGEVIDTIPIEVSYIYSSSRRTGRPRIASCGGNFLVVWADELPGNANIFGARISSQGVLLDSTAIQMSFDMMEPEQPDVGFDGTNYMVVWKDLEEFSWDSCEIYLRGVRITTDGTVLDSIPFYFVTLPDTGYLPGYYRKFMKLSPSLYFGLDHYLLAWNYRISGTNVKDLFGCRIAPDGSVLDTSYFCISDAPGDQVESSIAFDGLKFLVAWGDFRRDSMGFKPAVYFSRIDTSGIVLDSAGNCLIADTSTILKSMDVCYGGSNYLISFDNRRGNPFKYAIDDDIYVSRVDTGGNSIDPLGIPVTISTQHQRMPAVGFDGENHLVVWEDERGNDIDIYGAIVDSSGNVHVPPGIIVVSNATSAQIKPQVDFMDPYFLVVWEDRRFDPQPSQIFCARVNRSGKVLDPDGIHVYDDLANYHDSPQVSHCGNNFLVVSRQYYCYPEKILAFRIDTSGAIIGSAPIVIDSSFTAAMPGVCFDGVNYLISYRKGKYMVGVRLDQDTTIILPYFNISDSSMSYCNDAPSIAFNGTHYLVSWVKDDNHGYLLSNENIYGSRVSPDGYDLDSVNIVICKKSNDQYAPQTVAYSGNFNIVWMDDRYDSIYGDCNEAIYGTMVDPQGIVLDTNGILLTSLLSDSKSFSIEKAQNQRFLLCYSGFEETPFGSYRIFGTFRDTLIGIGESKHGDYSVAKLAQNYPNPFTTSTEIRFQTEETGCVALSVYDAAGRLIKRLVDERRKSGRYSVQWDGKDTYGRCVSSGIYFYRLRTKEISMTKKLIFIK